MLPFLRLGAVAALCLLTTLATAPAKAAERTVPDSRRQIELSFAPLVKRAAPAVVNIYAKRVVRSRTASPFFNDPFFRQFFGDNFPFGQYRERIQNSLGSGVIVRPDGLIVTNHHVIEQADEITVVLTDRREFDATVVLKDDRTDLAVLKIDTKGERLPYLELHDSDDLEVGDLVLAIGNPFGVGQTVTSGIISALARTARGVSDYGFFIQTDAAINPGNSGGALITMDGRLAGINTAIYTRSGGSNGIGFAIPANMVATVIKSATSGGTIVRPWLGASVQTVTPDIAESIHLPRPAGVIVTDVYPGGPAAEAGLRPGDVITAVNGREIADQPSLNFRIGTLTVGGTARLTVWRKGRRRALDLALARAPEVPPRDDTELKGRQPLSGATVANLSPALSEELSLDGVYQGVIVLDVRRGSFAQRFGLKPGDIILSVNQEEVHRVDQLAHMMTVPAARWRVTIRRGDRVLSIVVEA